MPNTGGPWRSACGLRGARELRGRVCELQKACLRVRGRSRHTPHFVCHPVAVDLEDLCGSLKIRSCAVAGMPPRQARAVSKKPPLLKRPVAPAKRQRAAAAAAAAARQAAPKRRLPVDGAAAAKAEPQEPNPYRWTTWCRRRRCYLVQRRGHFAGTAKTLEEAARDSAAQWPADITSQTSTLPLA